jgi:hypothetical protein
MNLNDDIKITVVVEDKGFNMPSTSFPKIHQNETRIVKYKNINDQNMRQKKDEFNFMNELD